MWKLVWAIVGWIIINAIKTAVWGWIKKWFSR